MWVHDEGCNISDFEAKHAKLNCPHCGKVVRRYVESWYSGGFPCMILAKYCRWCGEQLDRR